jgi:hypothetical protein
MSPHGDIIKVARQIKYSCNSCNVEESCDEQPAVLPVAMPNADSAYAHAALCSFNRRALIFILVIGFT